MTTRTLILAFSLATAVMPAAAQAEGKSAAVRIDDLDLTRPAARDRMHARLKSAARSVCGIGLRGAAENGRRIACVSAALAQVEPEAKRAIAQARGGTQLALLMIGTAR